MWAKVVSLAFVAHHPTKVVAVWALAVVAMAFATTQSTSGVGMQDELTFATHLLPGSSIVTIYDGNDNDLWKIAGAGMPNLGVEALPFQRVATMGA